MTAVTERGPEPRLARPAPLGTGAPARTVWVLARFEGRRLLRHPAVLSLLTLAVVALVGGGFGEEVADVMDRDDVAFAVLVLTLVAWGTLLAANLAALRSRRDHTTELLESLPTPAASRDAAHLVSVAAALPVGLALLAGWWLAAELTYSATVGTPRPAELAVGLLLMLGGGATGVLVARWLPTVLAGPVAVLATIVLQSNWGHLDHELRWLHFVAGGTPSAVDPWLEVRHAGWHLSYLLALVVLAGALALARHGLPRALAGVLAGAVAVALVAGWVQTRPPAAAQVAAIVDRLERPEAHQVCERYGEVRYCAYPTYRDWIAEWRAPIEGVLARVPAPVRARGLEVDQRLWTSFLADLHPQVRARLDPARVWRADGALHPGLGWFVTDHLGDIVELPRAQLALGFQAAAWAVGLPSAVAWPPRACGAAGQARLVAALWLAGQATPEAGRALRTEAARIERSAATMALPAALDFVDYYPIEGGPVRVPEQGAAGRGADVVAAARLLDRPADRVAAVLAGRWERVVDPATPSKALLAELGVVAPAAGRPIGEAPPCPS
jgi:hypothetical protein